MSAGPIRPAAATAQPGGDRGTVLPWLLLALAWLAATAWVRPLMLPDEGRYGGVAWEMLRSGDWLTPTLDGLPFFHKPPLFYWISGGVMALFGPQPWAARAGSLTGAVLVAAALFVFTRRWTDVRTARLALLALLAQPMFYLGAQFANLDMLVAGLIGTTVLLLADTVLRLDAGLPHRRSLLLAYAMAGLGLLAKGLIGVVIPSLVAIVALLAMGHWRRIFSLLSLPGLLLGALVAAPWFVSMARTYPDFLHYFFVVQHFQRFAQTGFNNVQPFWFYGAVLGGFCLPWWPWMRGAAPSTDPVRRQLRVWMLAWAGVTVVFFSLPASKLVGYVLPALAPLAWLAADGVARRGVLTPGQTRAWWAGNGVLALVGLAAVIVLAGHTPHTARGLAQVLARERIDGEPIVMLQRYVYDLPFALRLREPVVVVDRWGDPEIQRRDDWRKELADAAAFATPAAAAKLASEDNWPGLLCAAPVTWVVGNPDADGRWPVLAGARRIVDAGVPAEFGLWRVERRSDALTQACAGTPNAGSPGK